MAHETLHEAQNEEDAGERAAELASEVSIARTGVYDAACRVGIVGDDEEELTALLLLSIARCLLKDETKREGAWPLPEVAHLQRAWDHLVRLDDDASAADVQATVPPIPFVLHALGWGALPCGVTAEPGVTHMPSPSGAGPYGGKYRSSRRPNCPGCCR